MSKGLEALRRIENHLDYLDETYNVNYGEDFDTIEKDLKEKEELAQALSIVTCENGDLLKYKKALEIIKNIGILKPYETIGGQCWLETICDATKITKDNYDLLKEVLL